MRRQKYEENFLIEVKVVDFRHKFINFVDIESKFHYMVLRGLYSLEPINISRSTIDSLQIFFIFYTFLWTIEENLPMDFRNLFSILSKKLAKMRFISITRALSEVGKYHSTWFLRYVLSKSSLTICWRWFFEIYPLSSVILLKSRSRQNSWKWKFPNMVRLSWKLARI